MERFSESFHASLTGHNLTEVSKDIKIQILMEGIHSFQNIPGRVFSWIKIIEKIHVIFYYFLFIAYL